MVNGAPLAVSWPVIEKDCLTWAEEGAEMVRAVVIWAEVTVEVCVGAALTTGAFASTTALALQNNNAHVTSTTATTITTFFSPNIPLHLER